VVSRLAKSHGTPIFYANLKVRGGMDMAETMVTASELDSRRQAASFNQAALDEAARRGLCNGAFADSEEDVGPIAEELYPGGKAQRYRSILQPTSTKTSLPEKPEAQAARQSSSSNQDQGCRHVTAQAVGQ